MDIMSRMLSQLEDWRHFPAYQLERRVDVLFGILLPTVIGVNFRVSTEACIVIPEFPLHKGNLKMGENNQSMNVDFAIFFEKDNRKRLCLLELKTDQKSISGKQIKTMEKARHLGAWGVLDGVLRAANASNEPRKYAHLLWALHKIGCVDFCDKLGFEKMQMKRQKPGLTGQTGQLRKAKVSEAWRDVNIDLLMIMPCELNEEDKAKLLEIGNFSIVDFKRLAKIVRRSGVHPFGEEFREQFACYLDRWRTIPAGKRNLA